MTRYFLFGGLLCASLIAAWMFSRSPRVEVIPPSRGPAVQSVYATGSVEPSVMLPLAPRVSARLLELHVDEGDTVQKGEMLARLEDEEQHAQLAELIAHESLAEQEFRRAESLVSTRAISREDFDRARATVSAARAARKASEAKLRYLSLVAPFQGRIVKRDGEVGELLSPQHYVFWIASDDPLRITAEVDEEDISLVAEGQKAVLRADAFPGQTFDGTVASITPKGDSIARSYRVRVNFNQSLPLQIGMTTELNIIVRTVENALLVPTTALVGSNVFVVKDDALRKLPVVVGARGDILSEIREGLDETAFVVVNPKKDFLAGTKVRSVVVSVKELSKLKESS